MRGLRAPALLLAALLGAHAGAAPADDLLAALRRAQTLEARGEVTITVLFPPRAVPTRTARRLPRVAFVPALLRRNFTVTAADGGTVAGRATTRFDLTPNRPGAARWSLWVDRAWTLPLAYEERTAAGDLARRAEIVKVNAKPVAVTPPEPALPAGLRAAVVRALPGVGFPPGFEPSGVTARSGGVSVALTDGVNVLALVVAPRNVKAAPGIASRRVGGSFVWLVGNLPQDLLTAALAGIHDIDPAGLDPFVTPAQEATP
ncbi:hypothetical protein HNQ07_003882 [Deinococcus metalli]|uniref:Transcriptional regulator n=1 Tax=Deinococcus metalli TaxID=1141878 RepID=A0A7W8KK11_9DEIO|nr:transcriptional regulator [Deinococcus metalli]MBB5378376.1 hypothetical protein [Deinococcus metalli]GHF59357.1 hypothetical protein GCM10017781_39550 [Deinococcus metalli]